MSHRHVVTFLVDGSVDGHTLLVHRVPKRNEEVLLDFYDKKVVRYKVLNVVSNVFIPSKKYKTELQFADASYTITVEEISG